MTITALPTLNDPDMAMVTLTPFAPSRDHGSYAVCDPDHVHTPLEFSSLSLTTCQ